MVLNTKASGSPSGSAVDLDVGCRRPSTRPVGRSSGDGPISHEEVGQPVDADLARWPSRTTTGNTVADATPSCEGALELLDAGDVALEVALEQVVVGDHDALDQVVVDLCSSASMSSGMSLGAGAAALVDVGGVGEQVGDAPEARLLADRQLEGGDAGAEPIPQLVEGAVEAGPLPVELVDEHHAGHAQLGGQLPHDLGLDLDALDRAHHEHRQVGDPQRGGHVADEVGVAGGVDEVDLVVVPLERGQRQRQREAALAAPRGRSRRRWCRPRPGPCG